MPTVYRYADSNPKRGYYVKGWLPHCGNTTLQVTPLGDDLLEWMEFTTGQKIPGSLLEALRDAGILYTLSDGRPKQAAGNATDVPTVRRALTPRQYNRLIGFIAARSGGGPSDEIRALSQSFDPAHYDVPEGAIPDRPSEPNNIDHGRFQSLINEIFPDADTLVENQNESAVSETGIVNPAEVTHSRDERYCRITRYDAEEQKGTIEFLDGTGHESATFSMEDHTGLRIEMNTKYVASVSEDTSGLRITHLRRHNEHGPLITPVEADISTIAADVIVCPTGTRLAMHGGVAGRLCSVAGRELAETARTAGPRSVGDVVVTKAYELDAQYVIHAVTDSDSKSIETTVAILRDLIKKAAAVADELDARIVAVPLLGCGGAGMDPAVGVPAIVNSLQSFDYRNTEYRVVANSTAEYGLIADVVPS